MRSSAVSRRRRDLLTGGPVAESTDEWNLAVRGERPQQRADRNFAELLQELRVMQTGVQVLFALVLTAAFTGTMSDADAFQCAVYITTLVCCSIAAALFMAPVALHRRLFQRGRKADLVRAAHRLLQAGMLVLLLAVAGATVLVADQMVGRLPGVAVGVGVGAVFLLLWFVLPHWARGDAGWRRDQGAGRPDW